MNILVLGGSYFLGRYFVNMACNKNNMYVFNRGNCLLNMPGVTEIKGDRHSITDLGRLSEIEIDVVVDFCAYEKNDISSIVKALNGSLKQYIFVSTVDVYERGTGKILSEDGPFETRTFEGPEGAYIAGKIALEKEIREEAQKHGFHYTVMRPAFIYGPGNYAPRESIYFNWISQAGQILHPVDATGTFQMVYVMDAARAINESLLNEMTYDQAYNLTGGDNENYNSFADVLQRAVSVQFEKVGVTVKLVNEKGIPLPFPLTKEESNQYNGEKALSLINKYTELEAGMKSTAKAVFELG